MSVGNGKWQLAFWIVSSVMVGSLLFLGNSVIANDRLRVSGDKVLMEEVYETRECINEKLVIIMGDIREIKTRLGLHEEAKWKR